MLVPTLFAALVLALSPLELAPDLVTRANGAVEAAEKDILTETVIDGYRIGLVVSPIRTPLFVRNPDDRTLIGLDPGNGATHFVGIVLREELTKRFLPMSSVLLDMGDAGELRLNELNGTAYPVYGANVALTPGKRELGVRVSPPSAHRHADMLAVFMTHATTGFEVSISGPGKASVAQAVRPVPLTGDYRFGDDVKQALGESRAVVVEGDYIIGFIAEAPEPIWLWTDGKPTPRVVTETDTNHLEIVLLDARTGLPVTGARVKIAVGPHDVPLHMLMSEFYHYGATTEVPDGRYTVTATIEAPNAGSVGDTRFAEGATASFEWVKVTEVAEAADLAARITAAGAQYAAGDRREATAAVGDAFFAFESSAIHKRISTADPKGYRALEGRWVELRARMQRGAPDAEVTTEVQAVADGLRMLASAAEAEDASWGFLFGQSFLLMLREGFEAILLIGLLGAALRRLERPDQMLLVWGGAGVALAASILLAFGGGRFISNLEGAPREILEGVTILIAVGVLFTVSYWLLSKVESRHWTRFIKTQIEGAVKRGGKATLFGLAFLVVFREGVETILFYGALYSTGTNVQGVGTALAGGLVTAVVILVVVYFAINWLGVRIPMRGFFAVTGALLYGMAFKFAGDGIYALQEAGVVGATHIDFVPRLTWLGLYPNLQTTLVQGALVAALGAGVLWVWVRSKRMESVPA